MSSGQVRPRGLIIKHSATFRENQTAYQQTPHINYQVVDGWRLDDFLLFSFIIMHQDVKAMQ